jgi:GWxTD domain-containing protein
MSAKRQIRGGSHGSSLVGAFVILLILLFGLGGANAGQKKQKPEGRFKEWLQYDVTYIISDDERDAFLRLASDTERDRFIEQFWDVRNPTPGSPTNTFKEEHYRRIQYANSHFTIGSGTEGWRTDRGRIYIQLGEPAQKMQWISYGRILPSELWFYSNALNPSLPGYFYVLFYQRDEVGDYRLYSPYSDGPTKLVRGADTPGQAYQLLRSTSLELARASLTLLTDEPVDVSGFRPSLDSDAMLTRIRNLPNDRFTKERISRNTQLRGLVRSRVLTDTPTLQVTMAPFQNSNGETFVHFLAVLPKTLEQSSTFDKEKNQHSVDLETTITIRTPDGRPLFQQSNEQTFRFLAEDFEKLRLQNIAYEDRLPLAPGTYDVDYLFHDPVHREYSLARQNVTVPEAATGLRMGPIIAYEEARQVQPGQHDAPFEFFKIRFVPGARREFGQGERLSVFFQIILSPGSVHPGQDKRIKVEYALGSLSVGTPSLSSEEIEANQADSHGALLHGKQFSLAEFSPGNYRLVVKVTDPESGKSDGQTFAFRIVPLSSQSRNVTLVGTQFEADQQNGLLDYRRALSLDAEKHPGEATAALEAGLAKNPKLGLARDRLAELYFRANRFQDVTELFSHSEVNSQTSPQAVSVLLSSLERLGQLDRAVAVGQRAVSLVAGSAALYEQLASLYERSGQMEQAQELRKKAREILQTREQVKLPETARQ